MIRHAPTAALTLSRASRREAAIAEVIADSGLLSRRSAA
jgi:hypothetical protein